MRQILQFILAAMFILFALSLVGCAAVPDPNYQRYVEFMDKRAAEEQAARANLSMMADSCGTDARCVEHVASLASIAQIASALGASKHGASIQPYQRTPSTAERIGLALIGQLGPLAGAAVSWHQSDNSRDIALGQYQLLGGIISNVAAAPALQAPSISVGGDYVTGRVGDNVGGDQVGGNQHHGDAIGGDAIGGDRIDNAGNYGNDNRQGSPGPIDTGNRCEGDACQGAPPPEPAPTPGDGG